MCACAGMCVCVCVCVRVCVFFVLFFFLFLSLSFMFCSGLICVNLQVYKMAMNYLSQPHCYGLRSATINQQSVKVFLSVYLFNFLQACLLSGKLSSF